MTTRALNMSHRDASLAPPAPRPGGGGSAPPPATAEACDSGSRHPFPVKLYAMLEHAAALERAAGASWNPGGRSFSVRDPDALMRDLVPRYFKLAKFRSFRRQLNLWGFQSCRHPASGRSGPDDGWFHEHFVRGEAGRLSLIKRRPRGLREREPPLAQTRGPPMIYGGIDVPSGGLMTRAPPQAHGHGWSLPGRSAADGRADPSSFGGHLVSDDGLSRSQGWAAVGERPRGPGAPHPRGSGALGQRKPPPGGGSGGGGHRLGPKKSFLLRKRIMEAEEGRPCSNECATSEGASGLNANGCGPTHCRGDDCKGMALAPEASGPRPNPTAYAQPCLGRVVSNAPPEGLPAGPPGCGRDGSAPPSHGFGWAGGVAGGDGRARLASLIGLLQADAADGGAHCAEDARAPA